MEQYCKPKYFNSCTASIKYFGNFVIQMCNIGNQVTVNDQTVCLYGILILIAALYAYNLKKVPGLQNKLLKLMKGDNGAHL